MFSIHKDIHEKQAFTKAHYEIWLQHFDSTIDEHFEGKHAEKMKTQALSIATIMQIKFLQKKLLLNK